jgi:hypothetical protein
MKASIILALSFTLCYFSVHAQQKNGTDSQCHLLKTLLFQASSYEASNNFKGALNKLNSARIAARNCDDASLKRVDSRIRAFL